MCVRNLIETRLNESIQFVLTNQVNSRNSQIRVQLIIITTRQITPEPKSRIVIVNGSVRSMRQRRVLQCQSINDISGPV